MPLQRTGGRADAERSAVEAGALAEVISDVVGWRVRAEHVPAEKYKTTMTGYRLSPGFVEGLVEVKWCRDALNPTVQGS